MDNVGKTDKSLTEFFLCILIGLIHRWNRYVSNDYRMGNVRNDKKPKRNEASARRSEKCLQGTRKNRRDKHG